MKCRHCGTPLNQVFVDLATAPPSNAYLNERELATPEKHFPLRTYVCNACWLVQTEDFADADDLFANDYAYFSSYSKTWLEHAATYVDEMAHRFALNDTSMVAEIASNDGYLLQYVKEHNIPCYGVEPTASTAAVAREKGINVVEDFFGETLSKALMAQGRGADLIAANNVLAHVPDINDFVKGMARLLKPNGVATFEFPHLLNLVEFAQFDTVYHEHYSYLSLTAVETIFSVAGLSVFDVSKLSTHGGSLRIFAQRTDTGTHPVTDNVQTLRREEVDAGVCELSYYQAFQARANNLKDAFLQYLLDAKRQGLTVAGYGAAAKGNTLINYAGVRGDLLEFVADRNPNKQGKYLPGSRIPIVNEAVLRERRPDRIAILPWNLAEEIAGQLSYAREWGAHFVRFVPNLEEF